MTFSDKVKMKKRQEREQYMLSCDLIEKEALGFKNKKSKIPSSNKEKYGQLQEAINAVTDFYGLDRIDLPERAATNDSELDTVLGTTGLTKRKVVLTRRWWVRGEGPVVAVDEDNNIICMTPLKFGGYSYIDPKTNKEVKVSRENAKNIKGTAFCFYKPFPIKSMTIKDFIIYILKSFTKFDMAFLAVLALSASLLGLITPTINKMIYNTIIPSGQIADIFPLISLMLGALVTITIFNLFQTLWILRIGDKIQFSTQGALWIRLLNLPMKFFRDYNAGDLTMRSFSLNAVCNTISSSLIPSVLTAVFSFIYLGQIATISSVLLMPTILIIALTIVVILANGYFNVKLNKRSNELSPKLSGLVNQLFSGVSKIKLAGAETRAFSNWSNLYSEMAKIKYNPNIFIKLYSAINAAITIGGTMLLYLIAYQNNLAVADFIAFNTAYGSFSAAITRVAGIILEIANLKPTIDLLEPIFKEVPEGGKLKARVDDITGQIDINNLKFRYTKDGPLIINDLNLSIKKGEYLGIVGSTGCGKSTLFRLLLGFETPESGAIYYDNKNMENLDLHSVRRRIGIVLQNGSMFSDSIYSNITITNPTATMDEAWEAAEKAGCAEDIRSMPMGMHTMVSEDGGGLSGGQRQRMMIARALISSPKLLMFDEATSALDNISQATVVDTLAKMDITRIVIAHRLSTIKKCDRIIYLHKGQIVEEGTYDELMELNGRFADLARRQLV